MSGKLIYGVFYSEFDELVGPRVRIYYPLSTKDKNFGRNVASKTLELVTEQPDSKDSHPLAVIPFPSDNKKALSRSFEWKDEKKRGGVGMGALALIFEERNDFIFYKYMKDMEISFDAVIEKIAEIQSSSGNKDEVRNELERFFNETEEFLDNLKAQEIRIQEKSDAFPEESVEETFDYQFKIVICGDPECGKTSTVLRFTDNVFTATYLPTLGTNISEKVFIIDNKNISLHLWDIAGQSKFQTLRRQFYKGAEAVVLLYDSTRPKTFKNIANWHQDLVKSLGKQIKIILCANKIDLIDKRQVSKEDGKKLAEQLNMEYIETSALTGENIEEAFHTLTRKLV